MVTVPKIGLMQDRLAGKVRVTPPLKQATLD